MPVLSCSHPDCREPHGKSSYVTLDASQRIFCLYCFLAKIVEISPEDAMEIEEESDIANALINPNARNLS